MEGRISREAFERLCAEIELIMVADTAVLRASGVDKKLGGQIADIRIRLEVLQKRSIHARSIWSTFDEAVRKK